MRSPTVGYTRRRALHEQLVAVGQLHNVWADHGAEHQTRTGPVVQFWIWWLPRGPVGRGTMSPGRSSDIPAGVRREGQPAITVISSSLPWCGWYSEPRFPDRSHTACCEPFTPSQHTNPHGAAFSGASARSSCHEGSTDSALPARSSSTVPHRHRQTAHHVSRADPPTRYSRAPAVPRMRASPAVPARRSLGTTSGRVGWRSRRDCFVRKRKRVGVCPAGS